MIKLTFLIFTLCLLVVPAFHAEADATIVQCRTQASGYICDTVLDPMPSNCTLHPANLGIGSSWTECTALPVRAACLDTSGGGTRYDCNIATPSNPNPIMPINFGCDKKDLPDPTWVCHNVNLSAAGCQFHPSVFDNQSWCSNLPAGSEYFCRSTSSQALCGPEQQAARDTILKNITTNVPADKTVCQLDDTYPGRSVVYCAPATTAAGCTPSTAGNYSVCTDWPADNCFSAKLKAACPAPRNVPDTNPPPPQTTPGTNCTGNSCSLSYKLLEPLPGLENVQDLNFASFLGVAFKILITIGALISVGTLVFGGISYMVSDAVGEVGEAKKRMKAALFGMLILLGSWLLLNTINPQLLNFNLSVIGTTPSYTPPATSGPASSDPTEADRIHCEADLHQTIHRNPDGSWRCSAN